MYVKPIGQVTPPTLRQHSVLDTIQRNLEGIPTSPSKIYRDLYAEVGAAGIASALQRLSEARKDIKAASSLIEVFLSRSLSTTVYFLLGEQVHRCEKGNNGDECNLPDCMACSGKYN